MSTLVIYHEDNLANPAKLLTHFEDIQAELARHGVPFERFVLDQPYAGNADLDALPQSTRARLARWQAEEGWRHAELLHLDSLPPYALPDPAEQEPEHCHGARGARGVLAGGGILCLRSDGKVLAIGCYPGDLLTIPADMPHWFRPRIGQAVTLVRLAEHADAFVRRPAQENLAARMELPDL